VDVRFDDGKHESGGANIRTSSTPNPSGVYRESKSAAMNLLLIEICVR
jgi:hypothetical protein